MKPCAQNRKLIAWLASNALDARQTRQLQAHLETCEGCRRYLAEISNVTERLAAAETNPDVQASESFHRKVAGKLRTAKPDSIGEILAAYFRAPVELARGFAGHRGIGGDRHHRRHLAATTGSFFAPTNRHSNRVGIGCGHGSGTDHCQLPEGCQSVLGQIGCLADPARQPAVAVHAHLYRLDAWTCARVVLKTAGG